MIGSRPTFVAHASYSIESLGWRAFSASDLNVSNQDTLLFFSLEQVPETGRWRFINVSAETEGEVRIISYSWISKAYDDPPVRETSPPGDLAAS